MSVSTRPSSNVIMITRRRASGSSYSVLRFHSQMIPAGLTAFFVAVTFCLPKCTSAFLNPYNNNPNEYAPENSDVGGREGECPSPYTFSGYCVSQCRHDLECAAPRKCCFNGCAHLCKMPKGIKRGQCPASTQQNPYEPDNCNVYCNRDTDCSNDFKCCSVGSCGGRQCIPPETGISPPQPYPMPSKPASSNTLMSVCSTLICAPGTQCRVTRYDEPHCERLKPGQCPNEVIWNGPCVVECQHDLDCRNNLKCCRYGCGQLCTQPSRQQPKRPTMQFSCANVECRSGYTCDDSASPVQCIPANLPPPTPSYQYPIESKQAGQQKPGFCPHQAKMTSQSEADSTWCYFSSYNNTSQCSSDQHCAADLKCCLTPCGTRTCQPPQSNPNDGGGASRQQDNPCDGVECGKAGRCIVTNSGKAKCMRTDSPSHPKPPKYQRTPCGSQYCTPGGESCVLRLSDNNGQYSDQQQSPFQCVPNQISPCTNIGCADRTECVVRQQVKYGENVATETAICVPQEASKNLCDLPNICPTDSKCDVALPEFACISKVKNKFCQTVVHCKISPPLSTTTTASSPTLRPAKRGRCPTFPSDLITPCIADCDSDSNCPSNMKCCNRGCSRICLDPVSAYATTTTEPPPPPPPTTCANLQCPAYSRCEIVRPVCARGTSCSRSAVCVPDSAPSCNSALPCPPSQHCELLQVECVAAPCLPRPSCFSDDNGQQINYADDSSSSEDDNSPVQLPPQNVCDSIVCPPNRHCALRTKNDCSSCPPEPDCVLNNDDNVRYPITTTTARPPPPPLAEPTCDNFQCPYGQRCEIQQVCPAAASKPCYRQPQCAQDDSSTQPPPLTCSNVKCRAHTHCELRDVEYCGKPYCPPQPFCIPNEIRTTTPPPPTTTTSTPQNSCNYPCKYGFQCELRHIPCPSNSCPTIPLCVPQREQRIKDQKQQQEPIPSRNSDDELAVVSEGETSELPHRHYLGV